MRTRKALLFILMSFFLAVSGTTGGSGGKGSQLRFMMWGDAVEFLEMDQLLNGFARKHPEIGKPQVYHFGSFDYWDKFNVMLSTGVLPDVLWMGAEDLFSYRDHLLDLTDLLQRDARVIDHDDFFKELMVPFRINGRQYGIPKDFSTLVLYYNIDLFKKYGVKIPDASWTWDDFLKAARSLTIREHGKVSVYGFLVETWASWLSAFIWSNGGKYMDRNLNQWVFGKSPFLESNAETYQFFSDLMHKYKVAPDLMTKRSIGGQGAFAEGRVAMCVYGRWTLLRFQNITRFRWGIAELPRSSRTGKRSGTLFATSYAISRRTIHRENAWKLVRYLTSRKSMLLYNESQSALVIPSRKSIAMSMDFLKAKKINHNQARLGNSDIDHDLFIQALAYSQVPPQHKYWLKIREKLDWLSQIVFTGKENAKNRIQQTQGEFEQILKGE